MPSIHLPAARWTLVRFREVGCRTSLGSSGSKLHYEAAVRPPLPVSDGQRVFKGLHFKTFGRISPGDAIIDEGCAADASPLAAWMAPRI